MKAYGFFEIRDEGKQLVFEEIVIEAEDYAKAKKAFHYWLAKQAVEVDVNEEYEDHAEFMAIELAPKRAKKLKPVKADELISEIVKEVGGSRDADDMVQGAAH
ncbi:hypothetical protein [Thermococcus sp.]